MLRKKTICELTLNTPQAFAGVNKLPVHLVLDDIRSANNVGSVFRTADCFALAHVHLCGITARPPHREILKTALGASETVAWTYHEDAAAAVRALRAEGRRVYALEQTENSVALAEFTAPAAGLVIVLGNEVKGVSEAVLAECDGALEIRQFGTKHSLNVAVATGMVVFEVSRQLRGGTARDIR